EIGEASVGGLRVAHIAHPLSEERRHVHVEDARADEDLYVAHPTEPFVALRAVGRDAFHVAALRPQDVLPEVIERGVGGFKAGGFGHRRMKDPARDRVRPRPARKASDFDITKAVVSEMRLEALYAAAA